MGLSDTTGTIVQPDGSLAEKPVTALSSEEAALLRLYKKFLQQHGLREALYCSACWDGSREDGCRAYVTDSQILIECRCAMRFHQGQSF